MFGDHKTEKTKKAILLCHSSDFMLTIKKIITVP